MDEDMVTCFFFFLTQVASIKNPSTPPFELIKSQDPGPSCFASKNCRHPTIPQNAIGE